MIERNNISIIKSYQEEIKNCLSNENYLSALTTALIMPDICSDIEYENIKKVGIRYKKWLNEYLSPLISNETNNVKKYLNPENIYALRCTLLHLGSANASLQNNYSKNVDKASQFDELVPYLNNIEFDKVAPLNAKIIGTDDSKLSVMLDIEYFCKIIIEAIGRWLSSNRDLDNRDIDLFSIAYVKKVDDNKIIFLRSH